MHTVSRSRAKFGAERSLNSQQSEKDASHQSKVRGCKDTDTAEPATILIIAKPTTSRVISTALALAGYDVHRTPDAASAVEAARRLRPTIAIVAADLPGSSGPSVARRLRSSQDDLPVLVLGADSKPPGCNGLMYLPADVAPSILLTEIKEQIASRSTEGKSTAS